MDTTLKGVEDDSLAAQRQVEESLFQLPAEEVRQILKSKTVRPDEHYDVIIIGSGPGGATLARSLKLTGCRVLVLERGDFLRLEDRNWNPEYTITKQGYSNSEPWFGNGESYQPNMYYYVGGSSKLYASTVFRFREKDFEVRTHADGESPEWPVKYADFERFYGLAEKMYLCHGETGDDPTEPWRSTPFPYPAVEQHPEIIAVRDGLRSLGLHPFTLPCGLNVSNEGRCVFCAYCDCFPCRVLAKGDAELCGLLPAVHDSEIYLAVRHRALRLITNENGDRVTQVEVEHDGEIRRINGGVFVVACGAVNSPALLLRSAHGKHPDGLANSSGLVGRNYMRHVISLMLIEAPHQLPQHHFWKTLGINDWYDRDENDWPYPLGTIQITGNYHSNMAELLRETLGDHDDLSDLARRVLPVFSLTEDLPEAENRVTVQGSQIHIGYQPNNLESHSRLKKNVLKAMQKLDYKMRADKSFSGLRDGGGYHHCGTLRFGWDSKTSVLDEYCRAHDLANLYAVDASFFPSAAAINPLLTIAANALRVGEHLRGVLKLTTP
jgi:choline dehydrogenase-like flavoprotein